VATIQAGDATQPDAGALVRALLRPEAYPAPRPAAVELRETHASWVFLTEREAWKIKRPVDYGFLDYSDVDKRRRPAAGRLLRGCSRAGRRDVPQQLRANIEENHRQTAPFAGRFVDGAVSRR
jgi:hypothetical protein